MPKYPDINVQLSGQDGNAFVLMGIVSKALKRAGYAHEVKSFMAEAMAGDYNHLLRVCAEWVNVE